MYVRTLVVLGVVVALIGFRPAIVQADQVSALEVPSSEARVLAKRSLECLRSAEDSESDTTKRQLHAEGLELARRVIALDDSNPDGHFAVFAHAGRLQLMNGAAVNPVTMFKASRELERALELDPNHSDSLAAKGGMYRQLPWVMGGNLRKAEEYLKRSIELNPNSIRARIELAAAYRDMGHPERSLPLLERAAQIAEREGRRQRSEEARRMLQEIASMPALRP